MAKNLSIADFGKQYPNGFNPQTILKLRLAGFNSVAGTDLDTIAKGFNTRVLRNNRSSQTKGGHPGMESFPDMRNWISDPYVPAAGGKNANTGIANWFSGKQKQIAADAVASRRPPVPDTPPDSPVASIGAALGLGDAQGLDFDRNAGLPAQYTQPAVMPTQVPPQAAPEGITGMAQGIPVGSDSGAYASNHPVYSAYSPAASRPPVPGYQGAPGKAASPWDKFKSQFKRPSGSSENMIMRQHNNLYGER